MVLIIGILAAVAVPQYQKAVEKSKAVQGMTLVKSLAQAAQIYYLTNGTYPTTTDQLDVSLSAAQKEEFYCGDIFDECNKASGKYKGGGFVIYQQINSSTLFPHTLYCYEREFGPNKIETIGSYCQKLFNGTRVGLVGNARQYTLP